jgi:hypothetical protein
VPAAAVIPAPIAYINVAAVKKLVVGFLTLAHLARHGYVCECRDAPVTFLVNCCSSSLGCGLDIARYFTLKKLECLKQAFFAMNTLAWNNKLGLRFYFVGF